MARYVIPTLTARFGMLHLPMESLLCRAFKMATHHIMYSEGGGFIPYYSTGVFAVDTAPY